VFFTRNYIWIWIFQFLIATKDPQVFCPLLVWMNIKWITTVSLLQWKLLKQFFLMMETNGSDMVFLNFTLQCQHFDIFLSYQWNILLSAMFFFWLQGLTSVWKLNLLIDADMLTTLHTLKYTSHIVIWCRKHTLNWVHNFWTLSFHHGDIVLPC